MKEEKKEKRSWFDRILSTIIVLAILAGGGYFAYEKLILNKVQTEITEPEGIETVYLGTAYDCGVSWADTYGAVMDIMETSEASYFIIGCDDGYSSYPVTQVNKAAFVETCNGNIDQIVQETWRAMNVAYNKNYKRMEGKDIREFFGQRLFSASTNTEEDENGFRYNDSFEATFGGNSYEYFTGHQIELSCNDLRIKKIGVLPAEETDFGEEMYFITIEGTVTTDKAVGDMNDIGVFANMGESKVVYTETVIVNSPPFMMIDTIVMK